MAARERKLAAEIAIYARRPEVAQALAGQDWCDEATTDLGQACSGSELIFLCAPVERIIELSQKLAPLLTSNPIVTDVGSVKEDIVRDCEAAFEGRARFVGSHPMAGSEKTGWENGDPELFEDRPCFVTPSPKTESLALSRVIAFWKAIGCQVLEKSPQEHDQIVARVSHLPHMLASALADFLSKKCPEAAAFCGNGLRDTTRVASGSPELWSEIVAQNRLPIQEALQEFQSSLQSLHDAIADGDDQALLELLTQGKSFRDQL